MEDSKMGTTTSGEDKLKGPVKFFITLISFLLLLSAIAIALQSRNIRSLAESVALLEYRIETLEMEAHTNKLLIKQTQRLVVPDELALKRRIK